MHRPDGGSIRLSAAIWSQRLLAGEGGTGIGHNAEANRRFRVQTEGRQMKDYNEGF